MNSGRPDADPGEPDEDAQLALIDDAEDKFEDVEESVEELKKRCAAVLPRVRHRAAN